MPTLWRGQIQVIPDARHAPQWENSTVFNTLLTMFVEESERSKR